MPVENLIIGAGPAGLAMAGRLRIREIPFEIIEKSDCVAHSWTQHYDRLHLHTVKQMSNLPHLPFPEDYPLYVSRQQIVDYCEAYARHFEIKPHFGQEMRKVEKEGENWKVHCSSGQSFVAKRVIIATGINRVPHEPTWAGQEGFEGKVLHSRFYKNAGPFSGQRVLVIGMGNTGAEIALDLADSGVETFISVRGPVNIVPRDAFGRPTQLTAKKLAKLPNWLADRLGKLTQKLTVGDLRRYGIETPDISPNAQLRVTGKTPVIDLGTVNAIKAGKITVKPDVQEFYQGGVLLADGEKLALDAVILATGYRAILEEFVPGVKRILDQYGNPDRIKGDKDLEGLYFLGFDNFRPGGILGIVNTDSERIADDISRQYQEVAKPQNVA